MKYEIKEEPIKVFTPITIKITFETQHELANFFDKMCSTGSWSDDFVRDLEKRI